MIRAKNFKIKAEFVYDFKQHIKTVSTFRFAGNPTIDNNGDLLIDFNVETSEDSNKVNEWFNKIYELEKSRILPKKKWYQRLFN